MSGRPEVRVTDYALASHLDGHDAVLCISQHIEVPQVVDGRFIGADLVIDCPAALVTVANLPESLVRQLPESSLWLAEVGLDGEVLDAIEVRLSAPATSAAQGR